MRKVDSSRVVKALRERQESEEKANYTFRLNKMLMNSFKMKCEKAHISMAAILEELLKQFVEN